MAYSFHLDSESVRKSQITPTEKNINYNNNTCSFISKDLVAAAGFNVQAPIVEAIIGNLIGTLPTRRSYSKTIKCKVCDCELSSNIALNIHKNGSKHKKKLKALEIIEQLKKASDNGIQVLKNYENPKILKCEICSRTVNSAQQLEIHLSGSKHKKKAVRAGISITESHPLGKNQGFSDGTDSCTEAPEEKQK